MIRVASGGEKKVRGTKTGFLECEYGAKGFLSTSRKEKGKENGRSKSVRRRRIGRAWRAHTQLQRDSQNWRAELAQRSKESRAAKGVAAAPLDSRNEEERK